MSELVQVALAEDIAEAEEMQAILDTAGISAVLEPAVEQHPQATGDAPQKILVRESELESAQHALESMTDEDDLTAD